ncbi:MAG: helix-turn-helix transcriptional regulator [Chloroflexi bacterium]|nr:helix-turn-helix transcriptional regulator [Chloroflexota bacterium]
MDRLLASGSGRGGNALEQRLEGLPLTQRERSLVMSVLHGQSNRQIATALDQNEQSVKNALTAIYSKLGVKGRSELFHALFPL